MNIHNTLVGILMAIIAKLHNFKNLLSHRECLVGLYNFLQSCLDGDYSQKDFEDSKRIDLQNGIFAMLQTYSLKPHTQAFFETHRKYIDFQLTIEGSECFIVGDSKDFAVAKEYDSQRDLIVYKKCNMYQTIVSHRSHMCVFFPYDVHAGGLQHADLNQQKVYKVVAKVPLSLLDFI